MPGKQITTPIILEGIATLDDLNTHIADLNVHLDEYDRMLVTTLGNGMLWDPFTLGGIYMLDDGRGGLAGMSINSNVGPTGRQAAIQLYGIDGSLEVMTADGDPPGWLDNNPSGTPAYYRFVTTRDVDPTAIPAIANRVTTLENTTVPAVANRVTELEENAHSMRTLSFADKHGTVRVVAYYGATGADFLGVCFPYGFEISGKTWYMLTRNEFDSIAATSGTKKTITSTDGANVFYDPAASGGAAIFRVDTMYMGVQGGVTPAWGVSVSFGAITVSQPVSYALPTPQEAARIRMLEVAADAADNRADRAERVLHNLGNGLLQLSENDIEFAYPGTNNNGAFSLSGGTLKLTGGGGMSAVMLSKAARHFEATTTAGQRVAVMVVCKPGDNTGGAGIFLADPGNGANAFVCDSSSHNIANKSTIAGYTKQPSVAAGRLVVDVIDMTGAPQAGTGYTKRVIVRLGAAVVLDTYVDAGIGNLPAYTEPRIGLLSAWSSGGSWTLTDCKVSYGDNIAKDVPPTPESTIPAVLRHGHVYTVAVASGTVDLSAKTVEQGATAELYIDYTGGTLILPSWWWLDGMSSSEGDHDIPPWGQDMEANHRYVVVVRNDGRKTVANVQYEYPL